MRAFALTIALVAVAIACRHGEPSGDPKTPANSPIPKLPSKDPDRGGPNLFDAG
jgi:hypothetical protein